MFKKVSLGLAVAVIGFTAMNSGEALANAAGAGGPWTTADFNMYSCSNALYGAKGLYFAGVGGSYVYDNGLNVYSRSNSQRSVYSPNCASGHTSNAPSSVVTAVATLRAATTQTVGMISKRIAQVRADAQNDKAVAMNMDEGGLGLSAGDKMRGIGVWVQGSYTSIKDDNAATKFDGAIWNAIVGIDYKVTDRILIGLSGGYENSDLTTTFNRGNIEGTGWFVAPYVSFEINKMFSIDANGGYAWLTYDMDRLDPYTSEKFKGSTDANRYWGNLNLNATQTWNKFRLSGLAGVLYTKEKRDGFRETGTTGTAVNQGSLDSHLGQGRLGVTAGYNFGVVEPYVKATGEYDFTKSKVTVGANQTAPSSDDFGVVFGAGLNLNFSPMFKGMIEGNTVQFRDNYDEWNAVARLRVEF